MFVGWKCGTFTGETRAEHNSKYKQSFNWNNVTVYWKLRWWIITIKIPIYSILDERKVYFFLHYLLLKGESLNVFVRLSICPNLKDSNKNLSKNLKHCKSFLTLPNHVLHLIKCDPNASLNNWYILYPRCIINK